MIKKIRWEGNEIILTADLNNLGDYLTKNLDFAFNIFGESVVVTGFEVEEQAVPDMTVKCSAGIVSNVDELLIGEANTALTITAADLVQDRRDIIEIRRLEEDSAAATRKNKDPSSGSITDVVIDTETEFKVEYKVLAGTPGSTAPTVESGWTKICEVYVPAASTTVVNANIYNVDSAVSGVNNTSWTNNQNIIFRTGTIAYIASLLNSLKAENIEEISNLTASEGAQLENIDSVTISNTQWGYLGTMGSQPVEEGDSPTFNDVTTTDDVLVGDNVVCDRIYVREGDGAGDFNMGIQCENGSITADRLLTIDLKDGNRTLEIEANSKINQDLTTDADVNFRSVLPTRGVGTSAFVYSTSATHNSIFDEFSPTVPNVGDERLCSGWIQQPGLVLLVSVARIKRNATNQIQFVGMNYSSQVPYVLTITNGSGTAIDAVLAV